MKPKGRASQSRKASSAISPARAAAFDILLRVQRDSSYSSELLHSETHIALSALDQSLTTELVMGVLRWQALLDFEISGYVSLPKSKLDPEVLIALRLALYQFRWLTRIPARAAINESVELVKRARKRSAAPFVNAVLRKIAATPSIPPEIETSSPETLAASAAHPLWLVHRWIQAYGIDAASAICRHDQSIPITSIRLRTSDAADRLRDEGIELAPGAFLASAARVVKGDVTKTAAYSSGLLAIQDEASQLIAALVGHGARILDCCAAPGGKTLAIADRNPNSRIVAADLRPHRARLLQKMLSKRNPADTRASINVNVIAADARQFPFDGNFDHILADVPCSGTGTLARNPEVKWRLTPDDLADLQLRQVAILRSAMQQTSRGGHVLYSTCSLEREENEDVIDLELKENSQFRVRDCGGELKRLADEGELIAREESSLTRGPYLRTLPGVHPCDGFFAAILQRID